MLSSASCTTRSDLASRADVASSRTKMPGHEPTPAQSQQLALPAAQLHATVAHLRIKTVREAADEVVGVREPPPARTRRASRPRPGARADITRRAGRRTPRRWRGSGRW